MWVESPRLLPSCHQLVRDLIDRHGITRYTKVPIELIAEREGWEVRYESFNAALFGYAVVGFGMKIMVINADFAEGARRTAIAHEMMHQLFGHQLGVDAFMSKGAPQMARLLTDKLRSQQEQEANVGAAMLLVQPAVVDEYDGDIEAIAARCGVPYKVAELRVNAMIGGEVKPGPLVHESHLRIVS